MRIHETLALCAALVFAPSIGAEPVVDAQQVAMTEETAVTRALVPLAPPAEGTEAEIEAEAVVLLSALPKAPLYVPPQRGAPRVRIDGGTRTAVLRGPVLRALAPPHVGVSQSASPTLYWYASEAVDRPVTFILEDPEQLYPVYERELAGPFERGVHAVDLAALQVDLEPGRAYQWYVVADAPAGPRRGDLFAGAGVMHRPVEAEGTLSGANTAERLSHHARNGNWYDAVEALSRHLDAVPADALVRAQRAALLEQAELPRVAGFDRESLAHTR